MDNDYRVHYFIARGAKKVAEPTLDAGEKITLKLLVLDELINLAENPLFRSGELARMLLVLRLHPDKLAMFRERFFGGGGNRFSAEKNHGTL